eukprot:3936953-Pleurochrysis_carterae.AAC.1
MLLKGATSSNSQFVISIFQSASVYLIPELDSLVSSSQVQVPGRKHRPVRFLPSFKLYLADLMYHRLHTRMFVCRRCKPSFCLPTSVPAVYIKAARNFKC